MPVTDLKRVIFCGSRGWNNIRLVRQAIAKMPHDALIVTGGARGADTIANLEAVSRGLDTEIYQAQWQAHGRSAGMVRNRLMRQLPGVRAVVAFRASGQSRGTDEMIHAARAEGIKTIVVNK